MATEMKCCRKCGAVAAKKARFCPSCENEFTVAPEPRNESAEAIKYCRKCGKKNAADAKFCRYCGTGFAKASSAGKTVTEPMLHKSMAAAEAGEYDCGEIDLQSILGGRISGTVSSLASEIPAMKILSPAKALGKSIGGFFGGILNLVRNPKSAIVPLLFAVLWIVLPYCRDSDLLPAKFLSWLTYAEGGLDRDSMAGLIGGTIGKGAVAAALGSVFTGGIPSFFMGIVSVVKGTGEKRNLVSLVVGAAAGAALYFAFTGPAIASKDTAMAGIAGAVLALESIGKKDGLLYALAQALTSRVQDQVRTARNGKAQSLLSGIFLGFAIATALTALLRG